MAAVRTRLRRLKIDSIMEPAPTRYLHIKRQEMHQKLILVTNDDGYQAQGIQVLADSMRKLGKVIIVAPDAARSGAACSITPATAVRVSRISDDVYACSGTPVDCVKIALEKLLPRTPDLVVSGINHGDNASVSIHYSGTMGAVFEACMKGISAIGYSLRTNKKQCDFSPYVQVVEQWAERVLSEPLREGVCLNINFPETQCLKGSMLCRMAKGAWHTEWLDAGTDSQGCRLFTLTGTFCNLEPEATDTDLYALEHSMASVTPVDIDMTSRESLSEPGLNL